MAKLMDSRAESRPLAVGDHVVQGYGRAPTVWTVADLAPEGYPERVLLTHRPRGRKPLVHRYMPWHEIRKGRLVRCNRIPIREAVVRDPVRGRKRAGATERW